MCIIRLSKVILTLTTLFRSNNLHNKKVNITSAVHTGTVKQSYWCMTNPNSTQATAPRQPRDPEDRPRLAVGYVQHRVPGGERRGSGD
jgi:hypothetical protein